MSTDSALLKYLINNEPSFRRARLAALYSDFSSLRTLNPDGYNANIASWINGLSHAARAGSLPSNDSLIVTLDETLYRELDTKEWGRPLALGVVAANAVQRKDFMVLKAFVESPESIYRSRWALPSLGEIVGWGLKQLGLGFGSEKTSTGRLVILKNLEDAGREFEGRAKRQRGRVERIYSLRSFKEEYRDLLGTGKSLSDADFEVLLRYLQRDKGALSWDGETVKLGATGEMDSITAEDTTIANLKNLIVDLNAQTKVFEERVDELNLTARQAVERKNRVTALSALRSKKLTESTLAKRHATLAQLEGVLSSIEQAADQVELVRVMEGSATVLAGLNKEVGGVERVDGIVDRLHEEMAQVEDVGNLIAEGGQGVDEGEVDDELEAMEREERRKSEEVEKKKREKIEQKGAEETKGRLDALGEVERQAREKATTMEDTEKGLDENVEVLKRMSLDPPVNIPA